MRRFTAFSFALVFLSACATAPSAPPSGSAPAPASAPQTAQAPRSPNALTPVASIDRQIVQPSIRVGLLSDQPSVTFPRIAGGYYVVSDGGPQTLRRGFTATAPLSDATVRHAIQVSSVSDLTSANALAEKIRTETSLRVDTVFDPAGGAYRVLAGDFATTEAATPVRAQLTERGYGKEMLVVRRPSDEKFEKRHVVVDDEGDRYTLTGETLQIFPITAETLTIDKQPYRTSARLFINARGLYNVVNELHLEDYLLGVVPAEMGPTIYDEVEALKAQAVAARTYAVRNMGQFRAEGYDICPGPACQAYKGFGGEHELSTRAVRETKGLVLTHNGKMIDALYSATCGGETSDVDTMFPGRTDPYLKRVKCVELELVTLEGRADSGLLTEQQANARTFAAIAGLPDIGSSSTSSWSARDVGLAVTSAMRVVGYEATTLQAPASSRRGDVLRYLAAMLGLETKARVTTLPEDRRYWFTAARNPDEEAAYLAASFFIKFGMLPAQFLDRVDLNQPMPREELYALLGSWIREHTLLQEGNGKIHAVSGRRVTLKSEGKVTNYTLPAGIPIYRRLGDRLQEYRSVPVMIGDRATIITNPKKQPVAMIVVANYDGTSFDRTSSFANWTRSWRADELVPTINRRNPIQQLVDLEPVTIDAAQRIRDMKVTAEGGRTFVLKGLPVRWSLNVPDNLFVFTKTKDPDGVDRYTFFGKGWGHGTGMCQVGAYGMAFRGWTFDRILKHYYTNVEVVPSEQASK